MLIKHFFNKRIWLEKLFSYLQVCPRLWHLDNWTNPNNTKFIFQTLSTSLVDFWKRIVKPIRNTCRKLWGRYLVKPKGAAIELKMKPWKPCEMHPPGAVPLRFQRINCTYTYQKTSWKKGGLGAKTATATAREGNVSKMIGLWKRCKITTALLKPKTVPQIIIGGDRRAALSLTMSLTQDWDPGPNLLTPHPHCLPKVCLISVAPIPSLLLFKNGDL